jgi:hypothetical protein
VRLLQEVQYWLVVETLLRVPGFHNECDDFPGSDCPDAKMTAQNPSFFFRPHGRDSVCGNSKTRWLLLAKSVTIFDLQH